MYVNKNMEKIMQPQKYLIYSLKSKEESRSLASQKNTNQLIYFNLFCVTFF